MQPASFITQTLDMPMDAWRDRVRLMRAGDVDSIVFWDPTLPVPQPTPEAYAAALAAPEPIAEVVALLVSSAAAACDAVTKQVNVTATHDAAYANMAGWVRQAGGPPTADPYKAAFASFAASLGATPAAAATMFQAFDVAPSALLVILNALKAAAADPAATAASLKAALASFEAALADEVARLDAALTAAGLPEAVTVPAAIVIPGLAA